MKLFSLVLFSVLAGASGDGTTEHPSELDIDRIPSLDASGGALIRAVTIHSAVAPAFVADLLVRDGDIAAIGTDLDAPSGVLVIDGRGRHLAPGVIDTHSHMAIDGGVNEGTLSITAECDISDVIEPDDVSIYRALAGGVTTIQCLHGSANAIGGRSEVLKLRWKRRADELRFPGAAQGIKFALGENPKRSNFSPGERYPATRPGVESVFLRAFKRALEYQSEWATFEAARGRGEDVAAPRRDVRLDVLSGILTGDVRVHSHCYRADEILMLLRTAENFGFRVQTLQHVLEGYKVAHEIAQHGAGTSTFSDWWSYKVEAYDAIPQNAALLDEAGVISTLNSDSDELIRHLYHEAAKSVRYAGLDPVRALRLVTLNSAIQLGIQEHVGSIEVGKDADLVLLNADPLSVYARVEWTMVDGKIEFQRRDAFGLDAGNVPAHLLVVEAPVEAGFDPRAADLLAIVGGTLHPIADADVPSGTLLIQGGRIVDLGADVVVPAGAQVIDAAGQHVWPGMIALNTSLGLREIGSVRGTLDDAEIGGNQPDVRVASSIHADSEHIPVTRTSGITRSQTAPQGAGPFRGQSAVMRLGGDTWEEALTLDRDMLHVRFPVTPNVADEKREKKPDELDEMKKLLAEAREYGRLMDEAAQQGLVPPPFDPRLDALVPYARAQKRVAVHANNAQTILRALEFVQQEKLDAVLYGAAEGWKVVNAIREAGLSVVVGPVLALPAADYDPYDAAYANAAVLHRAGVEIAIMAADDDNTRNLPLHAGVAVAYGLPREVALRAITYTPAKLLGLESELGSLGVGKLADVVVTDGDLLEATTRVSAVLIEGRVQDLGNRQTELYHAYRERMQRLRRQ
ncbi:MAG: amidohydrolase family protein [Planctomycetes bacterium]|nr:amidohydrolase family protein [Planctomycetota bacterium]